MCKKKIIGINEKNILSLSEKPPCLLRCGTLECLNSAVLDVSIPRQPLQDELGQDKGMAVALERDQFAYNCVVKGNTV